MSAAAGNYRLRMQRSTAVDSADPEYAVEADADDVARPQGAGHDVGAFEYVETP